MIDGRSRTAPEVAFAATAEVGHRRPAGRGQDLLLAERTACLAGDGVTRRPAGTPTRWKSPSAPVVALTPVSGSATVTPSTGRPSSVTEPLTSAWASSTGSGSAPPEPFPPLARPWRCRARCGSPEAAAARRPRLPVRFRTKPGRPPSAGARRPRGPSRPTPPARRRPPTTLRACRQCFRAERRPLRWALPFRDARPSSRGPPSARASGGSAHSPPPRWPSRPRRAASASPIRRGERSSADSGADSSTTGA